MPRDPERGERKGLGSVPVRRLEARLTLAYSANSSFVDQLSGIDPVRELPRSCKYVGAKSPTTAGKEPHMPGLPRYKEESSGANEISAGIGPSN